MKKKVVIFGATGYLGGHLVQEFRDALYSVYAVTGINSNCSSLEQVGCSYIRADLARDNEMIVNYLCDVSPDIIVYAIGRVDYHATYDEMYQANTVPLIQFIDIVENAQVRNTGALTLFVNSAASYGMLCRNKNTRHFSSSDPIKPVPGKSVYCDIKYGDLIIIRKAVSRGVRAVIVQPGSLVGPSIGHTSTTNTRLIKKILKNFPVLSGGASYTSVFQAAKGIRLACEKGVPGKTYMLGGENLSMKDFALHVLQLNEKNTKPFVIPDILAGVGARLHIVLTPQEFYMGTHYSYLNSDESREVLGYAHSMEDLEYAIQKTLEQLVIKKG